MLRWRPILDFKGQHPRHRHCFQLTQGLDAAGTAEGCVVTGDFATPIRFQPADASGDIIEQED